MSAELRTLHVGNLPTQLTTGSDELRTRFGMFGTVTDVRVSRSSAFIDIEISEAALHRCQSILGKSRWYGNVLSITPAKQRFEDRLEKEKQDRIKAQRRFKRLQRKKRHDATSTILKALTDEQASKATNWGVGRYGRPVPIMSIETPSGKNIKIGPDHTLDSLTRLGIHINAALPSSSLTWEVPEPELSYPHCLSLASFHNQVPVLAESDDDDSPVGPFDEENRSEAVVSLSGGEAE